MFGQTIVQTFHIKGEPKYEIQFVCQMVKELKVFKCFVDPSVLFHALNKVSENHCSELTSDLI